jgi:hypothetical protein
MKASAKGYQSESDVKGKPAPVDGFFHTTIVHVNDSRTKKDGSPLNATIVEFEVLAGSVPGQEGKTVTQWFQLDDNGNESAEYCEKVSRLCMAAGLLRPGEEKDIDAADLENCQVVIKVQNYVKKDKTTGCGVADYGLAVWGVNHPDVASVPRNHDAIRLWNEARGVTHQGNGQAAGGNGNGHHAAATVDAGAGVNTDDI